ncbi:sigma-54-dependent Fis family transcriptional regulator [Geotalea uraniireducens]|uniref:Sigma-54-dependent Fis family transcriptional regulator n=1 Tax=Geotalea uraniireducens TaxID=351604 RepID=A0ABM8EK20_9BACT|nr:sigma-54 dependent transcriptional regulator [Geotalea uraniireducens]BDV42798.1 sigma-54-dependent Fis family transcriptional regulator [Geotalea uraniireducens]
MLEVKSGQKKHSVMIVDDDADFLDKVRLLLVSNDIRDVLPVGDSTTVLDELQRGVFSAILLDWVMPIKSGADLLPLIVQRYPHIPVIIMTAVNDIDTVVDCIKEGAFDYITKPLDSGRLLSSLHKAFQLSELTSQNRQLKEYLLSDTLAAPHIFTDILTCNSRMRAIFKIIETVGPTHHPVLITGETGVGKELIARAIHKASGLTGEFIPLNVAGLDDLMFTDTLFGHKRGAFTGANEPREGLIAKAQGGTLFLDEIGDLSLESQVKLLRLLQEHEYYRLGSDVLAKSDARVVAASNRDFAELINDGKFRLDLYQRLCFHELHIPSLRERSEDIPLLVKHYSKEIARTLNKVPPKISLELDLALREYEFPGNIRELISKVNKAVTFNQSGTLTLGDFPGILPASSPPRHAVRVNYDKVFTLQAVFEHFPSLEDVERLIIEEAVKAVGGNKTAAAELLGITRPTLNKRLGAG